MTASAEQFPAWAWTAEETLKKLNVDLQTGLSEKEVVARRQKYGYNELEKEPPVPLWKLVLQQFDDTLVKILLFAACVSFALAYFDEASVEEGLRAYIEPLVILLILILNAIVGVWQESNAEAALEALKELQSETAHVVRDGKQILTLPARELVPGDIVILHTGGKVPADIRLVDLKTMTLRAEQSSLTGEPVAVLKSVEAVNDPLCELQSKTCMLFASTGIANGLCHGVVTSIGMKTEIGKIQAQIQQAASEEEDTPLKKKLDQFGELLAQVIFWICVIVWLINYEHFLHLEFHPGTFSPNWSTLSFSLAKATYYFKIAVALAVAAIPEGLPAVITTCLALGTRKMAKENAIVRKLPSVETLGCTTVICSDKTGTLTTNQMSVVKLVSIASETDVRMFDVSGNTFNPTDGSVTGLSAVDAALEAMCRVCSVCNDDVSLQIENGAYRAIGSPTETALIVLSEKMGTSDKETNTKLRAQRAADPNLHPCPFTSLYRSQTPVISILEFDRDRKSMSVITRAPDGPMLLVKGGVDGILPRCNRVMLPDGRVVPFSPSLKQLVLAKCEEAAGAALRILALAQKSGAEIGIPADFDGTQSLSMLKETSQYEKVESDMVFLGFAGLIDPPRPEVPAAIKECRAAGIRVFVITGDNQLTANAICRQVGVFSPTEDISKKSITGRAFSELPHEKQLAMLRGTGGLCFSRAEPKHKQDIVRLLKDMGEVTAMTGDGVNDAPALKLADIGISMGIAGTEVAKEASDMILADDNFSTIVAAVREGRSIYNNMKAFIRYMISSNIGEVVSIFLTAALGLPEGLIPVQLLWVNLVTDGPPATALGFNPADADIMEKPPRKSDDNLITPWVFFRYIVIGSYVGIATVGAFVIWYMCDNFMGIDLSTDGHSTVTWEQLRDWEECPTWENFTASPFTAGGETITFQNPCDYFTTGKIKASTLSLSVIVLVEMFNAMNALSEDGSLLRVPFWSNPYLIVAICISVALHCVVLYVPFMADIFNIVPLNQQEWLLVILLSFPVIIIDEVLKFFGRTASRVVKLKQD